MENYVNSSLQELTKHGTDDFKGAFYPDSYKRFKTRFFYTHYHEELEIVLAEEGPMQIDINDKSILLQPQEMILINSNILHTIRHDLYPESIMDAVVFHKNLILQNTSSFLDSVIIECMDKNGFTAMVIKDTDIFNSFLTLKNEFRMKENGRRLDFIITILKVVSYIYKNYDSLHKVLGSNHYDDRIQKSIQYIFLNYKNLITVSDIASICNLSNAETSRLFKRYTGKSPIDYVIDYRINMASLLLLSTNKTITEIALEVGFESSNYFTIAFKKKNGITPKEYRKKN